VGTEIQLIIGHVALDYAKNGMGNDYGFMFQDSDVTRHRSDAISYEYYSNDAEGVDAHRKLQQLALASEKPRHLNVVFSP
jgi:hypothetical protein